MCKMPTPKQLFTKWRYAKYQINQGWCIKKFLQISSYIYVVKFVNIYGDTIEARVRCPMDDL